MPVQLRLHCGHLSFRLSPVSHGNTIALFFRSLLPNYTMEVCGHVSRPLPANGVQAGPFGVRVHSQRCSSSGHQPARTNARGVSVAAGPHWRSGRVGCMCVWSLGPSSSSSSTGPAG